MSGEAIYVSHTIEDGGVADRLKRELLAAGFTVAVNRHTVGPGRRILPAIRQSIGTAVRFLACFSAHDSSTAFDTEELSLAIERLGTLAPEEAWLIPVKLTPCTIPALPAAGGTLHDFGAVDLSNWDAGMARLLEALPVQGRPSLNADSPQPETVNPQEKNPQLGIKIGTVLGANSDFVNVEGPSPSNGGTTTVQIDKVVSDTKFSVANYRNRS